MKSEDYNTLPQKSGIYLIRNVINNKCYIGSAVNIRNRTTLHKRSLVLNTHHSIKLQRAYNKYGAHNFTYEVLAICPKEYCIKLEQWFIDDLRPEYNILAVAGSNLGYKWSEESRLKLSNSREGKTNANKGKKRPDVSKKFKENNPVKNFSKETWEKIRRNSIKKSTYYIYNLKDKDYNIVYTGTKKELALYLNCSIANIWAAIRDDRKIQNLILELWQN